jgi:hypothetical protein
VIISTTVPATEDGGRHLDEAIESALGQTWRAVEVIVVEDGAGDEADRGEAPRDPRLRVLRQPRLGLASARNRALGAARGELVVFLDPRDRLFAHAVEAGARALLARPLHAFVAGRARPIDAQGAPRGPCDAAPGDDYCAVLRGGVPVHPAAVIFRRRALLDVGGLDPRLEKADDYDLYLRLARRHPIAAHEEVVSEHRSRPGPQVGAATHLAAVLSILDRQRDQLRTPEERRAWADGRRHWREVFGPALPWEVLERARRGELEESARALLATLRFAPRRAIGEVGATGLRRLVRARPRA